MKKACKLTVIRLKLDYKRIYMTQFFSKKYDKLVPYIPGEQPQDMKYIKLNTNESPFAPSPKLASISRESFDLLRLYPDPENTTLVNAYAKYLGVDSNNVFVGNGSDEVLGFIFSAFFDIINKVSFPDITYGFYPVYCQLYNISSEIIPLKQDFTMDIDALCSTNNSLVIANPNAPTGIALTLQQIETIVASKSNRLVVVDEAYIDFGGESAVSLVNKYDNLIVCQTFSKSRSLAGARIGFAIANKALIADIKAIKYSFNSYNVNRISELCGVFAIADDKYFKDNCQSIITNRTTTIDALKSLKFEVLTSSANFILVKNKVISGNDLYLALKRKGILVRYFGTDRLKDYVRITIGSKDDMQELLVATKTILEEV